MTANRMVVKVFSATRATDRDNLGEHVTQWLARQPEHLEIDDIRTLQSSDQAYHCVTMVIFAHLEVAA